MKTISILDRLLLLLTALLAAYQVVVGVDGLETFAVICYTIAFGILLIACLLLIILGFDVLERPVVVIISTVIPLSLSVGLVWEYLVQIRVVYLIFAISGLLAVIITRAYFPGRIAVIILAVVHGISGMIIFLLPIILSIRGETSPGFALVGIGGALIGLGGLLLSFLKTGRPILPRNTILSILPALLLLMTLTFVAGFAIR